MDIRELTQEYTGNVRAMMQEFYASPAVSTDGSEMVFDRDIAACLNPAANLSGFVLTEAGAVIGYAMTTESFSTEFGRQCVWLEDLYIRKEFRGRGFGSQLLSFLARRHPQALLRLEVDPANKRALEAYRRNGFTALGYISMLRKPAT